MTRTIGISGGVASGKSTVTRILASIGAYVIDADVIGHDALKGHDVKRRIVSKWGAGVLDDRGEIDRKRLSTIVFSTPEKRKDLEAIVHPIILDRIREEIRLATAQGSDVIVLDAPLLYESGLDAICDGVLFVDVDEGTRAARACERGWTNEERTARERHQMNTEEKRTRADWIVHNSGSLEELEGRIKTIWQQILDH